MHPVIGGGNEAVLHPSEVVPCNVTRVAFDADTADAKLGQPPQADLSSAATTADACMQETAEANWSSDALLLPGAIPLIVTAAGSTDNTDADGWPLVFREQAGLPKVDNQNWHFEV